MSSRLDSTLTSGTAVLILMGNWAASAPRRGGVTVRWPAKARYPRLSSSGLAGPVRGLSTANRPQASIPG